jgi:hypothetical protein
MSVAYAVDVCVVPVVRAGVLAREIFRRGGQGEIAAVFDRSFYLRRGDDFICIGEPAIGNGPTTLIVAARVAELRLRQGQRAFISSGGVAIGDLRFELAACQTWRAPPWPKLPSPAALHAICALIARAATEGPRDSLAHALFAAADTPLARLARPRVARFEAWLSERSSVSSSSAKADVGWAKRRRRVPTMNDRGGHGASAFALRASADLKPAVARAAGEGGSRLSPPYGLVGLGPGLTPAGDDFLIGALAALDAIGQTNMHDALGRAVVAAAGRTSPLSASLLRAAAAGHVGENLHVMVAALVAGDADAAVAAAGRIGHTSGWDALAGAVETMRAL